MKTTSLQASVSFSFGAVAIVSSAMLWVACSSGSSPAASGDAGATSSGTPSGSSDDGGGGGNQGTGSGNSGSGSSGNGSEDAGSTGSGTSHGGDASTGGSTDAGSVGPLPTNDGGCPGTPCPSGESCCSQNLVNGFPTCQASCPSSDLVACTSPADCIGAAGGSECCATTVLEANTDGAAFPYCGISTFTSHCGTCTTSIGTTCTSTEQLHVCTQASDCASEGNVCCRVSNYEICVSSVLATFGNLTCL